MQTNRLISSPFFITSDSYVYSGIASKDGRRTPYLPNLGGDLFQHRVTQPQFGMTPEKLENYRWLHICIQHGELEDTDVQLNHQMLEQPDDYGRTPLLLAAHLDDLDDVRLLIDYEANLAAKDSYGNGLLHLAAIGGTSGNGNVLRHLLLNYSSEFDINAINLEGKTPYDMTKQYRNPENAEKVDAILSQLRQAGGRPSTRLQRH